MLAKGGPALLAEQLRESVGDEERRVDEALHAVADAGLGPGAQLALGGAHTGVPTGVIHLVYLKKKICYILS